VKHPNNLSDLRADAISAQACLLPLMLSVPQPDGLT
jgi:hypothetical protein